MTEEEKRVIAAAKAYCVRLRDSVEFFGWTEDGMASDSWELLTAVTALEAKDAS